MALDPDKEEKLKELREQIIKYVKAEKLRLSVERDFLQSVLDRSLGGATKKATLQDQVVVVDSVKRLLEIKSEE
tara:strand:+ start:119 stop:340 length:222 start_codon:yes stop_codon:yes gene_type:complete